MNALPSNVIPFPTPASYAAVMTARANALPLTHPAVAAQFERPAAPAVCTTPPLAASAKEKIAAIGQDRDATIKALRVALKAKTGRAWSVTGGRGTAWGWITITAPAARRTYTRVLKEGAEEFRPESYEWVNTGEPDRSMSPEDSATLSAIFGDCHHQGIKVDPRGKDYERHLALAIHGEDLGFKSESHWD
jgi:hypothetical protein